jgi:hypothetical protein
MTTMVTDLAEFKHWLKVQDRELTPWEEHIATMILHAPVHCRRADIVALLARYLQVDTLEKR